jgi:molybdenum cofactor biosynthesis protein B
LLRDTLRTRWHWPGLLVSDWNAIAELRNHGVAETDADAAELALRAGIDVDMSSQAYATLAERIGKAGHELAERAIVADDVEQIRARVKTWIADPAIDVIITTGGTGFTGRDVTPEALEPLFEKRMDAFSMLFLMVSHGKIGTSAVQTRATAGVAGATYIFCLPGSPGACKDAWDAILVHQLDYRYRPCNFVEIMPRLDEHLRRPKAKGATV